MPTTNQVRRGRPSTGARAAVLAAAQEILAESGVARLSTKQVAQRAGVAESSIFYHFGDRLGLLQAVVSEHLPPVREIFDELDSKVGTDELRDNLIALVDVLEGFFVRVIPAAAAIQSDAELRAGFQERSQALDIGPHRASDGVRRYLEAEQAEGRVPADTDISAVALLLVGAAYQRAFQRLVSPPEAVAALPTPEAVVTTLLAAIGG